MLFIRYNIDEDMNSLAHVFPLQNWIVVGLTFSKESGHHWQWRRTQLCYPVTVCINYESRAKLGRIRPSLNKTRYSMTRTEIEATNMLQTNNYISISLLKTIILYRMRHTYEFSECSALLSAYKVSVEFGIRSNSVFWWVGRSGSPWGPGFDFPTRSVQDLGSNS